MSFDTFDNFLAATGWLIILFPLLIFALSVACFISRRPNFTATNHISKLVSHLTEVIGEFESCISGGNGELEGDREMIRLARKDLESARQFLREKTDV